MGLIMLILIGTVPTAQQNASGKSCAGLHGKFRCGRQHHRKKDARASGRRRVLGMHEAWAHAQEAWSRLKSQVRFWK